MSNLPILQHLYSKSDLLFGQMVACTYALTYLAQAFTDRHAGCNAKGVVVSNHEPFFHY